MVSAACYSMQTDRWLKIEELFNSTLAFPPCERGEFLDSACAADPDLRAEVDSLLREIEDADEFLSAPAFTLGARLLARDPIETLEGQTLAQYQIVKPLGRGGMGNVFLAEDPRLGRLVALKLLPPSLTGNQDSVLRFQQEARAASAISHPNVAHIYEFGQVGDRYYLTMEYVEGKTLRELLKQGSLSLGHALDFALQVAQALQAAHEAGVVHRDIKPENIMVRPDGYVKVLDFGLAKLASNDDASGKNRATSSSSLDTQPGLIMGTTAYMSPEQLRGEQADARTDIWSWGVVLYEMLAGEPPFRGATSSDVIAEILKANPKLLATNDVYLPERLRTVLRKALAKDTVLRYRLAEEVIAELRKAIEVQRTRSQEIRLPLQPVPGLWIRLTKPHSFAPFKRKHELWLALIFVALVATAFAYYSFSSRREKPGNSSLQIVKLSALGNVLDAVISPDGKTIAYVKRDRGHYSLRIRDTTTDQEVELLPESETLCWGLRFSHNNQHVYYLMTEKGSTISVLYRMPTNGGMAAKLIVNVDTPIALSPDGVRLAFVRRDVAERKDSLMVADVDGGSEFELASRRHPEAYSLTNLGWSPDGNTIAAGVTNTSETTFKLVGVTVHDGRSTDLSPQEWTATRGIVWTREGHSLLLAAGTRDNPAFQVWRVPYPTGSVQQLTHDQSNYEDISLTNDEKTLLAMETGKPSNLWLTSLAENRSRELTAQDGNETAGVSLLQTGQVVYSKKVNGLENLWLVSAGGESQTQLTTTGASHPAISPDNRLVVFTSISHGARHLTVLDLNSGASRQLTNGDGEDFASFTPDGNSVVYTSLGGNRYTLWRVPISGGQSQQLTTQGLATQPSVSPDGKAVACAYRADVSTPWKVAVIPLGSEGAPKVLAISYALNQTLRWSKDGKSIFYIDSPKGVSNIWRISVEGEHREQLTSFSDKSIFAYDISADARSLVAARGAITREVVLLKSQF
jgi:serine/threonine protein kinase